MNTLITCLLIAIMLPYLVKIVLVGVMRKAKGGYDNNQPREQQAALKGYESRVLGAHLNCFESLIVFSTAVLTALATNHTSLTIQLLAEIYIISRLVYIYLYVKNLSTMRSLVWLIGFICCISIIAHCFS